MSAIPPIRSSISRASNMLELSAGIISENPASNSRNCSWTRTPMRNLHIKLYRRQQSELILSKDHLLYILFFVCISDGDITASWFQINCRHNTEFLIIDRECQLSTQILEVVISFAYISTSWVSKREEMLSLTSSTSNSCNNLHLCSPYQLAR